MKLKINKNVLLKKLKNATAIIGNNTNLNPILNCILIDAERDLVFTCSNGQISAKFYETEGFEIIHPGRILIKAKILFSVVSKLTEDELEISKVDQSVITIKTKSFNCQINTLAEEQYPLIDFSFNKESNINLSLNLFDEVLRKLSGTTLNNTEQLKVINAIYFDAKHEENRLNMIATDSFRLGMLTKPLEGIKPFSFLIEPHILKIIIDIVRTEIKEQEDLEIYLKHTEIVFQTKKTIITYKMIEGNYPNIYNALVFDKLASFKIERYDLMNALERGMVIALNEKIPTVNITGSQSGLNVKFSSYELGSSEELLNITDFSGTEFEINLNANYLLNLLKNFDHNDVMLEIGAQNKPIILKDLKDEDFVELVFPMRV